jgi:hypothetical protein
MSVPLVTLSPSHTPLRPTPPSWPSRGCTTRGCGWAVGRLVVQLGSWLPQHPNQPTNHYIYPTQVGYWEPAKFVAKLRALKTDDNLLLLKVGPSPPSRSVACHC